MVAINIPIYLLMRDKETYISSVLMMAIMFGGLTIMSTDYAGNRVGDSFLTSPYLLGFILLGVSIAFTVIAYFISTAVYIKKDLT